MVRRRSFMRRRSLSGWLVWSMGRSRLLFRLVLLRRNPRRPLGVLVHLGQQGTAFEPAPKERVTNRHACLEMPPGAGAVPFAEEPDADVPMRQNESRPAAAGKVE